MVESACSGLNAALMSAKSMIQPGRRIDLARDVDLDPVAVPVQARALVALGHERQAVGGLERELLEDLRRGRARRCASRPRSRRSCDVDRVHTPVASFPGDHVQLRKHPRARPARGLRRRARRASGSDPRLRRGGRPATGPGCRPTGRAAGRASARRSAFAQARSASSKQTIFRTAALARRLERASMNALELARVRGGRHARTRRLRRDREPVDAAQASRARPSPGSRPRPGSPRS